MSKCYNIDDSFFISLSLCLSLCYSCVWVSVVWVFMWPCACAYIYAYGEYTVTVGALLNYSLALVQGQYLSRALLSQLGHLASELQESTYLHSSQSWG